MAFVLLDTGWRITQLYWDVKVCSGRLKELRLLGLLQREFGGSVVGCGGLIPCTRRRSRGWMLKLGWKDNSNYPAEQLSRTRGKLILAGMPHLRPGDLPGRHDLVQPCVSWITLHTNGKNKLKNVVLDHFTHWAAFPRVTELSTETIISPLEGAALGSAPFKLL